MTLEQLGGLGEFLGAIAVFGSLLYLAREIRESSRSTRLAAMQTAMLASQNVMALPVQDLQLARVVRVGLMTPDALTEDEFQQLRYYLFLLLRVYEDTFVQNRAGVIDDETWEARARSLCTIFSTPGGRRVWRASDAYRADFREWLNEAVAGEKPSG